jgi:hypothetical protein
MIHQVEFWIGNTILPSRNVTVADSLYLNYNREYKRKYMWRIRKIGDENGYIVRNKELANQLLGQFTSKGEVWEMVEITEYELGDPMEQ